MSSSDSFKEMAMLLQDPSLRDDDGGYLYQNWRFPLDKDFLLGMGSSKLVIADPGFTGLDWANSNVSLTFEEFNKRPIERPIVDNPQFHQVNTFAVCAHTLQSFEHHLGREVAWKHGGPLVIFPHGFKEPNAYYNGGETPMLSFGYFNSPLRPGTVWTCLSHDIIAHELGHAILDSFRPMFNYSSESDSAALHESLADLLALFTSLQHPAIVERLYRESDGNMREPSVISYMAEEFGIGLAGSGAPYLRSALEGPMYWNASSQPHARSTVWTAAIYDVLCEMVDTLSEPDPSQRRGFFDRFQNAVIKATEYVKGMLIRALHCMPPTGIMMPVLARLMFEVDRKLFPEDSRFRDICQRVFERRGLGWDYISLKPPGIGPKLQDIDKLDPSEQLRLLYDHARELHIPIHSGTRIMVPKLSTVTRRLNPQLEGKAAGMPQSITERYLQYSYAMVTTNSFGGEQRAALRFHHGGTLVMDENWNDIMLVNDPVVYGDDFSYAGDPWEPSLQRAMDRFQKLHRISFKSARLRRAINKEDLTISGSGHPFSISRSSSGAPFQIVWRSCNLIEHAHGVAHTVDDCPYFGKRDS